VVFVFDRGGKLQRLIGSEKNGRGLFARPTGIAVDSAANRLYVTDTARHQILLLDLQGKVLGTFGTRGTQPGQFNFPTELLLHGGELLVVDAMNFRIQTFSRDGAFLRAFGTLGNRTGALLRPKGLALDSEGNIYVADALLETVQVFDREGNLLYFFGHSGGAEGEFQLPAGLFIDPRDRIYVADSLNRRVQVFQFRAAPRARSGGQP
jgi:DNA-binding beta-propeller fold protein YncE